MAEADPSLEEQVVKLQEALREREKNLAGLSALVYSWAKARILGDPLDDFFGAPENWEVIRPEDEWGGWGGAPDMDCIDGCRQQAEAFIKRNCQGQNLDDEQRRQCAELAWKQATECIAACPLPSP